jgi:hypothetical protein
MTSLLDSVAMNWACPLYAGPLISPEVHVALTFAAVLDLCNKHHLFSPVISCAEIPHLRHIITSIHVQYLCQKLFGKENEEKILW